MSEPVSSAVISVQNLTFSYDGKTPVLKNINLEIEEGDFVGLIGPNGGGKSTLLKLMLNILPLQQGRIRLFGRDMRSFKDWTCIGYVSQKATHFDRQFPVTVWEVVSMARCPRKRFLQTLKKEDVEMIERSLADVQMLSFKNTPLHELSGGQQQRVFIARCLASNPCILALDEPTIGVDLHAQEQFYLLLQKLRREKHLTIMLVSHDIDVIATQVNKFACVNQELVYHGEPKEFIKQDYLEKLYGKNLRFILHGH